MADAVESMWWKVGVNYDGKPLEKFKKDLEEINDHVRKLNQPTSDGNAAITERMKAYRDLEKQVKKTADAMANPKQSLEYHKNIGEHMKRQRSAIDAQVAGYRDGGKAIEAFGQAQLKINDRGALIRQEQMNGAMRRHELATAKAHLAVSNMFSGMSNGSRDAIGRLDLMRANIEKLGRVALGAGLVGGTFGMMSSAAENVRQSSNAGFVANVSANDMARYDSQTKALGGNEGDGKQIIGNIDELINKLHFGQLDSESYRRFGMADIDVAGFQRYYDAKGNHTMDATRDMQQRLFEAHQRNPGLAKQAAQGIIPASAQQALLTRPQSEWDEEGRKRDALTGTGADAEEAQRRFTKASQHMADAMDGLGKKILVEFGPQIEQGMQAAANGASQFFKDLKGLQKEIDDDEAHRQKYYKDHNAVLGWALTQIDKLRGGDDREKGYELTHQPNGHKTGQKSPQDPNRPHDQYDDLWALQKIEINFREARRAKLRELGQPADTLRLKETEANDAAIMQSHENALNYDHERAQPTASVSNPVQQEMKKTEALRRPFTSSDLKSRIIGKESGGRNFNSQGGLLTSTAGALGKMQILPSTAKDPSLKKRFGIDPARDNSPEELERVATELIEALKVKYGGDEEKVMAAYHSGDSRVDNLVAEANAKGLDWRGGLRDQGRKYIDYKGPAWKAESYDSRSSKPSYAIDQQQYMPSPATGAPPQPQMQPLEVSVHIDARGSDSRGIEYAVERGVKQAMGQANMSMMASNFSTFKGDV